MAIVSVATMVIAATARIIAATATRRGRIMAAVTVGRIMAAAMVMAGRPSALALAEAVTAVGRTKEPAAMRAFSFQGRVGDLRPRLGGNQTRIFQMRRFVTVLPAGVVRNVGAWLHDIRYRNRPMRHRMGLFGDSGRPASGGTRDRNPAPAGSALSRRPRRPSAAECRNCNRGHGRAAARRAWRSL